jgi:histidyl-tRNA synthetase
MLFDYLDEKEIQKKTAGVKDLRQGVQQTVPQAELLELLRTMSE